MKPQMAVVGALVVLLVLLACGGVVEVNSPCDNKGDVYARDGGVYYCKEDRYGNLRWGK